jgi:threonyl-tRNA synthetase
MPERFGLTYTGADNAEHQPVMIHRALFGSFERFLGIMIEHYGGEFPLWLAPVQAIVLPISERLNDYAETVRERLRTACIRVELDDRGESIGRKIREAELRKIPNMLIVGDREAESDSVSRRTRSRDGREAGEEAKRAVEQRDGEQGNVPVGELIENLLGEARARGEQERVG